jgi:hypothetical protein
LGSRSPYSLCSWSLLSGMGDFPLGGGLDTAVDGLLDQQKLWRADSSHEGYYRLNGLVEIEIC